MKNLWNMVKGTWQFSIIIFSVILLSLSLLGIYRPTENAAITQGVLAAAIFFCGIGLLFKVVKQ